MTSKWELLVALLASFYLVSISPYQVDVDSDAYELFKSNIYRRPPITIGSHNFTPTFYSRRRPTTCKCGIKPFEDNLYPILNWNNYYNNLRNNAAPVVQPLIMGGSAATVFEFPWMVAIADISIPRQKISCGGALINSLYVLTAAHCVQHKYKFWTEIWFNAHDMDKADKFTDENVLRRKVKRFIIHPNYPLLSREHDIALVELSEPIDFTRTSIRPICLPSGNTEDFAGQLGTVAGWGYNDTYSGVRTPELQKLTIPILSHEECLKTNHFKSIKPNMLCAGDLNGGRDACYSDSGGPLIVPVGSKNVVVGIVAWGRGCGRKNLPGVYTRVSSYLKWINSVARKGEWCQRQNNKFLQHAQF